MKKKSVPQERSAAAKPFAISLPKNAEGTELATYDALEDAQRTVTAALLRGELSAAEARTRTRAIEALARRMRDADHAQS